MLKRITATIFSLAAANFLFAQQLYVESLLRDYNIQNDTIKMVRLRTISRLYAEINPDSAYLYAEKLSQLARQLDFKLDEASGIREMGYALLNRGNYPRSLQTVLSAMAILEDFKIEQNVLVGIYPGDDEINFRTASPRAQRLSEIAFTHQMLGVLYANSNNYQRAWHHHLLGREKANESGNVPIQSILNLTLNRVYLNLKKTDSALFSIEQSYEQVMKSGYKRYLGSVLLNMGRTHAVLGNTSLAKEFYKKSLVASEEQGYFRGVVASSLLLSDFYQASGKKDSAFIYIKSGLEAAQNLDAPDLLLRSYTALTRHYRTIGNNDSAVKYQALIININDSLFNAKQMQQFQNIDFDEQQRKQQIKTAQKALRNKWRMYALLAGLVIFLFIALILWRNSLSRKKANLLLSKQKSELQAALSKLQATQKQLVQSEKMALLGELTAGIAHEIQNPLNFVNNFSEVSTELLDEMQTELKEGNATEALLIATDVKQNLSKINHHGKRADAIVKNMLLHSRKTSGAKEPADLNALVDEYLRLSYHDLRTKDKNFNAILETNYDPSVGSVTMVSQDIGRVLLNLFNNAFYSVAKKKEEAGKDYEPTVIVRTVNKKDKVEVYVKDNGTGIPENVLDKIYQPFFTTKPTGEGTGLGLSLSYDIITKGHSGQLRVQTIETEGSEFIIELPNLRS
ncbi:MAG: ATP-binding protein [Chitinophagaceae bacterium]